MLHHSILGLLRATCLVTILATAIVGALLSTAKAKLGESLIQFGEQLLESTHGRASSDASRLVLNGLEFDRITITTPLGLRETLDRLTQFCHGRAGVQSPEKLLAGTPTATGASAVGGVYRHESEKDGVLACIDTGGPLSVEELVTRLKDFVRTGNLSSIGRLRYMLLRRGKSMTSVFALWTGADAPLLHLFPRVGDAPGRDIPGVPRPNHSERLLSAWQPGAPYALAVYRSTGSSVQAFERYGSELAQHGWRVTPTKDRNTLIAQQGSRTLVIRSAPGRGGRISTTVAELS